MAIYFTVVICDYCKIRCCGSSSSSIGILFMFLTKKNFFNKPAYSATTVNYERKRFCEIDAWFR